MATLRDAKVGETVTVKKLTGEGAFAKFSMKEPQPLEHASLSRMLSISPFLTRMHFMS